MDRKIVNKLKKITKVKSTFSKEGVCLSLDFTDDSSFYFGNFRHSKQKKEILKIINNLENLKYLNLRKNKTQNFELNLKNLVFLDLGSNDLLYVPEFVKKNNNLSFLNLGANKLNHIPDWFSELGLETLKIHKNNIDFLPKIKKNIKHLNLYQNKIKQVPNFIWDLNELEYFCWGMSDITKISSKIANLKKLLWLSLVVNEIKRIPNSFCDLINLKGLRLSKNKIEKLPNRIGNLVNLKELILLNNKIKYLPKSFGDLNLKYLNLDKNPINIRSMNCCKHVFGHGEKKSDRKNKNRKKK